MSLQYFGGNDLVHALSEEEGAEIGYPRRSRKAGKARGSAEQRPAVTGELAKSSLRARLCSRSVYRPIAIGLQAARRVRVVPEAVIWTRHRNGSAQADACLRRGLPLLRKGELKDGSPGYVCRGPYASHRHDG
jgi:hypothetical protein